MGRAGRRWPKRSARLHPARRPEAGLSRLRQRPRRAQRRSVVAPAGAGTVRDRRQRHRALRPGRSRTNLSAGTGNDARGSAQGRQPASEVRIDGQASQRHARGRGQPPPAHRMPDLRRHAAACRQAAGRAPRRHHLDRRPAQARRSAVPPRRRQLPRHPGRDTGQRAGDEPHLGQLRPHRLPAGSQRRLPDRPPARAGGRRRASARWPRCTTPSWAPFRPPRPSRMPSISPAC